LVGRSDRIVIIIVGFKISLWYFDFTLDTATILNCINTRMYKYNQNVAVVLFEFWDIGSSGFLAEFLFFNTNTQCRSLEVNSSVDKTKVYLAENKGSTFQNSMLRMYVLILPYDITKTYIVKCWFFGMLFIESCCWRVCWFWAYFTKLGLIPICVCVQLCF
jgi:hypothetical protein